MRNKTGKLITAAAIAGLLSGAAIYQANAREDSGSTNVSPGKVAPSTKTPKVHDCSGQNECKGIGGCKTDDHSCKFKNSCKGKGGCAITDKDIKNWEKQQKSNAT